MSRTRLLLVDDHVALLGRLREALGKEFDVVGTAKSAEELFRVAAELEPDVIVMDVSMPGMSGIEAARVVTGLRLKAKVVILSMHSDEAYVREAFKAGASGYVLKVLGSSELATAIHEVEEGREYMSAPLRRPS